MCAATDVLLFMHVVMDHRRIRIRSVVFRNSRPDASRLAPRIIMSLLLTQLFHTRLNWLRSRPKMSHADVESTEFRLLARCLEGIPEQATRTNIGGMSIHCSYSHVGRISRPSEVIGAGSRCTRSVRTWTTHTCISTRLACIAHGLHVCSSWQEPQRETRASRQRKLERPALKVHDQ